MVTVIDHADARVLRLRAKGSGSISPKVEDPYDRGAANAAPLCHEREGENG